MTIGLFTCTRVFLGIYTISSIRVLVPTWAFIHWPLGDCTIGRGSCSGSGSLLDSEGWKYAFHV